MLYVTLEVPKEGGDSPVPEEQRQEQRRGGDSVLLSFGVEDRVGDLFGCKEERAKGEILD
jgi:hypothetical protein